MPVIHRYGCNQCEFELPSGWGSFVYAVDHSGQRVVCGHPGEDSEILRVTGLSCTEAWAAGRTGTAQYCVCLTCLKQFSLDLERDPRACPECPTSEVRSLLELVGQLCPRCRAGVVEQGSLVRWTLDPDWEHLPVPQIVKDLTELTEHRGLPPSLKRAAEVGGDMYDVIFLRLLVWWEGDYFSEDREQQDSAEILRPQSKRYQALLDILEATPGLADLIVIHGGRCWFAPGVSPEVRRGIKNYLRKHRTHWVMC